MINTKVQHVCGMVSDIDYADLKNRCEDLEDVISWWVETKDILTQMSFAPLSDNSTVIVNANGAYELLLTIQAAQQGLIDILKE